MKPAEEIRDAGAGYGATGSEQPVAVEVAATAAVLVLRGSRPDLTEADAIDLLKAHFQGTATQDSSHSQPSDVAAAGTRSPVVGSGPTTCTQCCLHRGQIPVAAVLPTAYGHVAPPDDAAVSRARGLSEREKSSRLIQAAKEGAVEELRALLAAGADVHTTDSKNSTALQYAACVGHVRAIECLLAAGADPEAGEWSSFTALHAAAMGGQVEAAKCLLAAGAEVDARDWLERTPLHTAAIYSQTAVLQLLLRSSAKPNAVDRHGRTPLDVAESRGQKVAALALIEAGGRRREYDAPSPRHRGPSDEAISFIKRGVLLCSFIFAAFILYRRQA